MPGKDLIHSFDMYNIHGSRYIRRRISDLYDCIKKETDLQL